MEDLIPFFYVVKTRGTVRLQKESGWKNIWVSYKRKNYLQECGEKRFRNGQRKCIKYIGD